jgi:hypothetical protein
MEGVGLKVKNDELCGFGFCPFDMGGCYGMGINRLPLYFMNSLLFGTSSDLFLFS